MHRVRKKAGITRRVTQRYTTDCAVTCIAMVAGVSWRRAVYTAFPRSAFDKIASDEMSIDFTHARRTLKKLGVSCRYTTTNIDLDTLRRPAILMFEWDNSREFHCVVYDPSTPRGRFLDPTGYSEGRSFYIREWRRNGCESLVVCG